MAKTKMIRIKKPSGGTRLQKVMVLASGKFRFMKNPKTATSKPKKSVKAKAKKSKRSKVVKTKTKAKAKTMLSGVMRPLSAMAYGAVRGKVNLAVRNSPLGKLIPAGNIADEAGMLVTFWGARKLGLAKNPIGGSIIRAGEAIEWASIGEELATTGFNGLFNPAGASNSGRGF